MIRLAFHSRSPNPSIPFALLRTDQTGIQACPPARRDALYVQALGVSTAKSSGRSTNTHPPPKGMLNGSDFLGVSSQRALDCVRCGSQS
jgi:hypothetical protein